MNANPLIANISIFSKFGEIENIDMFAIKGFAFIK
jgi:hypothetical protein